MLDITENIVRLLQEEDEQSIELIYDHYSESLYGVIFKMVGDADEAQDVLQESFIKIWSKAASYDPTKARLFTWLLTICRNTAIDRLRARKNKRKQEIQTDDLNVYDKGEEIFIPGHMDISERVKNLESKYAAVIEALFFKGLTQQEASDYLDLPLGTIKSRLRIGLRELHKIFSDPLLNIIILWSYLWMIA